MVIRGAVRAVKIGWPLDHAKIVLCGDIGVHSLIWPGVVRT
jgi:hypothetical protein